MKHFFICILLFTGFAEVELHAQDQPGIRDSLYSQVLQEQRTLYVNLPENYKADVEEPWDVIFVTDGEWNTGSTQFIHNFARYEKFLPHAIIIGIPNTYLEGINQRDRDFLPVQSEPNSISGGADAFLEFFRKELIPYVTEKYAARGDRTLVGHSYGGVFALYALLAQPDLFENYIATDPPYHWHNGYMQQLASEKLPSLAGLNKSLWISGIEATAEVMGNLKMQSILKDKAPDGLYWQVVNFPNETHNSVRLKGVYDGLKFSYNGFSNQNIEFHPLNGTVLKDKPFTIWLHADTSNMFYTTDGSEPTTASAKMQRIILLEEPTTLKVKSINKRTKWDHTLVGNFEEGQALPPIAKPKKAKAGGFNFAYYEGDWDKLPDFKKLKPQKTGTVTKDFDIRKLPRQEKFACLMEGYLEIEHEGYYIFALDSDDGSRLYLGDKLLIDYDGLHGSGKYQSYLVPLKKGFYPLKLEYFQKGLDGALSLIYVRPNDTTQAAVPIPLERQYGIR